MAEGKNSFLLYSDLIHTVKKMTPEKAGELFLIILEYVNDEDPIINDLMLDLVFEPIKQSLKRDLKRYTKTCERNKINGSKGGRPPKQVEPKKPTGLNNNRVEPKKADSDSDSDSDSGSVNVNDKEKKIKKIQEEFYTSLIPFVKTYTEKTIREFYDYWSEPNKSKTKIKFQMEKTWDTNLRLQRWTKSDFNKSETKTITKVKTQTGIIR